MTPPRTLEDIAHDLWVRDEMGDLTEKQFLDALREAADAAKREHHDPEGCAECWALGLSATAARREEREALRTAYEDFMDETVDWVLRMNRTADPGTDEPKNFEPDLRTRAAIAAWLMDSRKPIFLAWLDARSRGEEPKS